MERQGYIVNNCASRGELPIRLRRRAQVGLDYLVALREELVSIFVGHGGYDNAVVPSLPVGGRGDFIVRGQLQRVDDAKDLLEVAAGAGRIRQDQLHLFVRADDEYRSHREGIVRV